MSAQQQIIQYIPLSKLVASPRNIRRKHAKADVESLAASIDSQGLLQNLCVVPGDHDCFEVEAGGRRRLALKLLVKQRKLAKDWPVPCHVVAREDGREVSLTENVQRVSMDAMDEVDAYAALVAEGKSPDEIARRFGVELRHVEQRLALAGLSPKIKAAWKRGDVSLEAARAFCLVNDHGQQEVVFRSLSRPVTNPSSVRARLMDGRMRATDRVALFVGLEAYEAAGGKVLRDLFDADAVFIEAPALLMKLAEDKLGESRDQWLARGWSWVDINLGAGRGDGVSSMRLHPQWREPTTEEQAELDRISTEIEELDAELEDNSVEDDPRWQARDDLEAAYETIRQAGRCWTSDIMALSGVMLSIDHDGGIGVLEGLVRIDDQKRVNAFLKSQRAEEGDGGTDDCVEEPSAAHASALPKAVNRDLTMVRTRAIRLALSSNLDIALALCVASMIARSQHRAELIGVAISAQERVVEDLPELEMTRAQLAQQVPSDEVELIGWALDLSRERLLAILALLVAGSVDLAHEDASPADFRKQAIADMLAQQLDIDMTNFWSAGLDYWVRLPKSALLSAIAEAPTVVSRTPRARDELLKACAKSKKTELAAKAAAVYEGVAYLPGILVTPMASGSLLITPAGEAAIATPVIAAE